MLIHSKSGLIRAAKCILKTPELNVKKTTN
jgi:hypothetical protein